MSKYKKPISTLEFYNYGEANKMTIPNTPSYKVKVSDKDGNIITIEKDDALYACVNLSFDSKTGILKLLDVAHNNSVLAEIELPNADYIYNCRFDEAINSILFDVKSLYGNNTRTIELNVDDIVELYEAGQGIEIGDKNEATGRKPISIKLAEGEELLQLTDSGLGLDEKVITEEELDSAISGKANTSDVEEIISIISGFSGGIESVLDKIEEIENIIGTDIDDPNLDERIDNKADLDEFNDLEEEVGEIEASLTEFSGKVESLDEKVNSLDEDVNFIEEKVNSLEEKVDDGFESLSAITEELSNEIASEVEARKENAVASADYDSGTKKIIFKNYNDDVIDEIDATDFIKDGMVDNVELIEMSGDTYLHIVFNTDAGKETIDINIGDLFEADNYYTKAEIDEKVTALQEMDAALANVDTQQWAVINQNRIDMENVDRQLWDAITNEASTRESEDAALRNAISGFETELATERELREDADDELRDLIVDRDEIEEMISHITDGIDEKIEAEKYRAETQEQLIRESVSEEQARAIDAETDLQSAIDAEKERAEGEEEAIRLEIASEVRTIDGKISGFTADLAAEQLARTEKDNELQSEIDVINVSLNDYATKEYVDGEVETAKESAIESAKTYTDEQVDAVENELKAYCDSGHTELQQAISNNTTRINVITEWDGQGVYDDSDKNGILDVLHREFHEYEKTHGAITNIEYVDGNLIITYETPDGEKQEIIPISELIVLDDYYNKEETDALLDEKLDKSEYEDISEQVSANTENISMLDGTLASVIEKLGYTNNDTLITTNEHEVAFGEYNVSNTSEEPSGQTIFSIGNGTSDEERSNAVEVMKNGDVYLWIEGEFMNVNQLLSQIAHEIY